MPLTVQQTLHGYSDGHRLIADSLKLASSDARVMLVMSDLSGSGVKPAANGYLTGYPLDGAGKYVLARTWAAPEMPRPGCVWTHSLLIDNADLAALTSAEGLLAAFQRPMGPSARTAYSTELTVSDFSTRRTPTPVGRVRDVVNAIYSAPEHTILVDAVELEEDETLALAIWMQQWPRLRRAFGFCTLSGMDRSSKGVPLDLQMARVTDRQLRSRFPNAAVPAEIVSDPILGALVDDLIGTDHTNIREFLRRTGGDVEGGRRAMVPLCRLHSALFSAFEPNLPEAVSALAALDHLGSRSARSVRALVGKRAIEVIDRVDDTVFDFVLELLQQQEAAGQLLLDTSFGRALWLRAPTRFIAAITEGGPAGEACRAAAAEMTLTEIISGLSANPTFARDFVPLRPKVLECADFWRVPEIADDLVEFTTEEAAERVASALVVAERVGPARFIVSISDAGNLIATVEAANAPSNVVNSWFRALASQPLKLADALASGKVDRTSTLVSFARSSEPDAVPNDYGEDPWIYALRKASGSISESDQDYLAAFMVSRALGSKSRSRAELLRYGYGRLYRALQQSRLPSEVERMVSRRLDSGSWFEWDNCALLRETTARTFIDSHLDPEIFGRLTDDGALTISLIDEAARTARGRRYLAKVREAMKSDNRKAFRARADHIAKKIK